MVTQLQKQPGVVSSCCLCKWLFWWLFRIYAWHLGFELSSLYGFILQDLRLRERHLRKFPRSQSIHKFRCESRASCCLKNSHSVFRVIVHVPESFLLPLLPSLLFFSTALNMARCLESSLQGPWGEGDTPGKPVTHKHNRNAFYGHLMWVEVIHKQTKKMSLEKKVVCFRISFSLAGTCLGFFPQHSQSCRSSVVGFMERMLRYVNRRTSCSCLIKSPEFSIYCNRLFCSYVGAADGLFLFVSNPTHISGYYGTTFSKGKRKLSTK